MSFLKQKVHFFFFIAVFLVAIIIIGWQYFLLEREYEELWQNMPDAGYSAKYQN